MRNNLLIAILVILLTCFGFCFAGKYSPAGQGAADRGSTWIEKVSERVQAQASARQEAARAAEEAARAAEEAARQAAEQGIWNILLIGTDKRPDWNYNGNSDTMVLVSVNQNTRNFRMVSFMRDTYANIPGFGGRKLNSAYALAGAPLLMETLRSNFQVKIDNYVAVNFNSMVDVINTMGGVDIELNESEAAHMGLPAGWNHLDGNNALTYSRIRYIGNADYERTSRQRRVLSAMFVRFREMDAASRLAVIPQLLNIVETDIGADRIAWVMANIGSLVSYDIVMERVPFDGLYGHSGEDLVPDYPATNARLYEFLH